MLIQIITVKTNGKLYIVGEYNVLEKKGNALLYGIDKHITFNIMGSDEFQYETRNQKQSFNYNNKNFVFESNNNDDLIKKALEKSFEYLTYKNIEINEFKLIIKTELENGSGEKYGFGSSSAILTGVIKSILLFHGIETNKYLIYKLAVLAQHELNDLSSGGDLASSLFEGVIYYRRYNKKWFDKLNKDISVVDKKWPHLKIKPLKSDFNFGAIWTKTSYKTKKLSYKLTKKDLKRARRIIKKTFINLMKKNYISLKESINDYQKWMEYILFSDRLYTNELRLANSICKKHSLASKISGAGGGDSVIFLYPEGFNLDNLDKELANSNLKLFKI